MLGRRGARIVHFDVFRRLIAARDFMVAHQAEPLTLAAMAQVAGVSPYHFLRLYRRAFGRTPHEQLTELRLERARDLLARGQHNVTEVCLDVGYTSLGSFSALFARRVGRSPLAYQREVRTLVQVPERLAQLYIPCCFLAAFASG